MLARLKAIYFHERGETDLKKERHTHAKKITRENKTERKSYPNTHWELIKICIRELEIGSEEKI